MRCQRDLTSIDHPPKRGGIDWRNLCHGSSAICDDSHSPALTRLMTSDAFCLSSRIPIVFMFYNVVLWCDSLLPITLSALVDFRVPSLENDGESVG